MSKKRGSDNRNIVFAIFGVLVLGAIILNFNSSLSGNASKSFSYQQELREDEYALNIGDYIFVDGNKITLITIGGSKEAIVDVGGIQKSINQYSSRVINDMQIQVVAVGENHALLKIINLNPNLVGCNDSDGGDIYVRGECSDRFYVNKPVQDICDFNRLIESTCGYDRYVDEVHCLSHVVECADGCNLGACNTR